MIKSQEPEGDQEFPQPQPVVRPDVYVFGPQGGLQCIIGSEAGCEQFAFGMGEY